jgi:hypothetical protein
MGENVLSESNKFINIEKKAVLNPGAAVLSHSLIFPYFFPSLPQIQIKVNRAEKYC